MNRAVYVAGAGVISAIGKNIAENLDALEQCRAGIGYMVYLDSVYRNKLPVAEVKASNEELSMLAGLPAWKSRTALLGAIAAREAISASGINDISRYRTGFISANSVGGMDKSEKFFAQFLENNNKGRLRNVVHHECGSVTELVADALGIKDHISTVSTACSSSANAIFYGARLIKSGLLDMVVAGGTDSLTRFTLNGFNTLMILDEQFCQPFDENRRGLNLGEGAGYIVLVSEELAATLPVKPTVTLSGYCNANDAYHQTASSPDGTGSYLAMSGALRKAGLLPSDIDYINLHGTGTQNNDIAEGTAIRRLFNERFPKMSSTKTYTGHTLGACGGIEAVFSILALTQGMIFPNLRLQTPMKDLPFTPETALQQNVPLKHVLSNSFGFGGNCSSLVFSKAV